MATGFVWKNIYGWHDTGTSPGAFPPGGFAQPHQHFESAESKTRFASLVDVSGLGDHLVRLAVTPASEEDLLLVHDHAHVTNMRELSANSKGGDAGDGLSPFGHGSYEIALMAVGGTIAAVNAVLNGEVANAYALVRPPGHHARPGTGMGFCLFSNSGVAIRKAMLTIGIERVAVVDWDVHHGNGTQEIFYNDPNVLTISIHQDGLFPPDSGHIHEQGVGLGVGANINVPLPAGSGNGAYLEAMDRVVIPALERFKPDLIVVASGFDAAMTDPLGRMIVTANGYRPLTQRLMEAADSLCQGRLVMSHEGGYSATYVPFCGLAVLETMSGVRTPAEDPLAPFWDVLPDQVLQPWQTDAVQRAAQAAGLVT
jgi:acetoin utilization deacetylase AcuC-like enzyme